MDGFAPIFFIARHLPDVITCATFFIDWFRGFDAAEVKICSSSLTKPVAVNTVQLLPCCLWSTTVLDQGEWASNRSAGTSDRQWGTDRYVLVLQELCSLVCLQVSEPGLSDVAVDVSPVAWVCHESAAAAECKMTQTTQLEAPLSPAVHDYLPQSTNQSIQTTHIQCHVY